MKKLLFTKQFKNDNYKFYLKNTYNGDFIVIEIYDGSIGYPSQALYNNGNPIALSDDISKSALNFIKSAVKSNGYSYLV